MKDSGHLYVFGTLGVLAAAAMVSPSGSRVRAQLVRRDPKLPTALPTDREIAQRIASGRDVLGGQPFDQAVVADPRLVDAIIQQDFAKTVGRRILHAPNDGSMFVQAMGAVRAAGGVSATTVASVIMENLDQGMVMLAHAVPQLRGGFRDGMGVLEGWADRSAKTAREAAAAARKARDNDANIAWNELAAFFDIHPQTVRQVLGRLQANPRQPRIGQRRRIGQRNQGSAAKLYGNKMTVDRVIRAWSMGRAGYASSVKTDGYTLWSYSDVIGVTLDGGDKIVLDISATRTTRIHIGKARSEGAKLVDPDEYREPRTITGETMERKRIEAPVHGASDERDYEGLKLGPWKVDQYMDDWIIEHSDDDSKWKRIGKVGALRINYYDKAIAEAAKRNRKLATRGSKAGYPSYPFYVVDKATGQVLSGWDYREDAKDALTESHEDRPKASMSVMTVAGLKRKHGKVSWAKGR